MYGTKNNDTLFNISDNVIYGRGGDDGIFDVKTAFTPPTDDQFFGGKGDDFLYSSDGSDVLSGGKGDDHFIVEQSVQSAVIIGGKGHDEFHLLGREERKVEIRSENGHDLISVYDEAGTLVQSFDLVGVESYQI